MSARFRKLNMELMERREMMAADITAVLQNGNLYINEAKGSVGKDQGVSVSQLANGNIRVQGLDAAGTGVVSKVNGKAFVDFAIPLVSKTGSTRSLFANLGAGNDLIRFDTTAGVVPSFQNVTLNLGTTKGADNDNVMVWALNTRGSITVDTGIGNDWVFMSNVDSWGTQLKINTGAGADTVTIKNDSHLRGSVDIQTYSALSEIDNDVVYFDTNTVVDGSVNVRTGGGVDQFLVTDPNVSQIFWGGLTAGSISLDMGADTDLVSTRGVSTVGNFQVFTGSGADSVLINSRSIQKLDGTYFISTINGDFIGQTYSDIAEADNDSLEFLGAQINGSLIARMGAGNDYFALSGADHVSNDVDLHMDDGNDNAYIDGYVGDHIMAWMGAGDDTLRIGRIWAYRLLMDGNLGWDSLVTSNEMYASNFDYLSWEVINGRKTGLLFDVALTDAVFAKL